MTHAGNYKKLGQHLNMGDKLYKNPNLALDGNIGADIIVVGMKEGLFTGKKLSSYINGSSTDYANARRIINGTDKMDTIAAIARKFEAALRK